MVTISSIEPPALPELLPWAQRYYVEDQLTLDSTKFLRALSAAIILGRGAAYWILDNATKVGYLIALDGWSVEYGGLTVELDELFVMPEARGRSIASSAIHALLEICQARGVVFVGMETTPDNDRAGKLYQRLGFSLTERPVYRKFLLHEELRGT